MAQVQEPQFTSLSARIAALNQQGVGQKTGGVTLGKRPPPPLPPAAPVRPPLASRTQTVNNPPIASYGSSVTKKPNNLPIDARGNSLLPPPPVDRDQPSKSVKTPPLPARRGPPPLPNRKDTQSYPALPARKASGQLSTDTQMTRRGSNASTMSISSTISGLSLGQPASSISSVDSQRKLPPTLDMAKLPPLPPNRREIEQRTKAEAQQKADEQRQAQEQTRPNVNLVTAKSTPNVPLRGPPPVDRDMAPRMPPRPSAAPKMPPRNTPIQESPEPASQRRLPPAAAATRSPLTMGFSNKPSSDAPKPGPRPSANQNQSAGPPVVELTDRNFDSIVKSGKPAYVDFYLPKCSACVDLKPIWEDIGRKFAFASDRVTIARMDTQTYRAFINRFNLQEWPSMMYFDGRSEQPKHCPFTLDQDYIQQFLEDNSGIYASDAPKSNGVPPPINMSSKPSINQVQAVQSQAAPSTPQTSGCLICRDFSGPDQVAAQHPRQSLPRTNDVTGHLADVLCGPFPSATDKARAIFVWLHHNVAYDTAAFFGNRVKFVEPRDTIASGLAVCGGYAGVFTAIALKAGLEAVMVTGHGKGFGYTAMQPGDPVPPCDPSGHAWNAVRIDGGEWKLLDSCWGAGNVGNQAYTKNFKPSLFTMSNEDFGLRHFPQDKSHFFRADGKIPTWAEYMIGPAGAEELQLYSAADEHGFSGVSFSPRAKRISVSSNEVIRFQFSKLCEHWDHEKNGKGKPYCMLLKIGGLDGRKEDRVPFENNDFWWWIDVKARDLGAPGQTVSCYAVTSVNGKDARGMTRNEYLGKKGKAGMGFAGIAAWELVR
jgi:thiol-disulfide isomerase/thioredoxin